MMETMYQVAVPYIIKCIATVYPTADQYLDVTEILAPLRELKQNNEELAAAAAAIARSSNNNNISTSTSSSNR